MALKVVGAGFGRTGTLSLKTALETLGFGPCYHMMEVFPRPEHVAMWHRLAFESRIDWDALFSGFSAAVDWPAARWWREIAAHYPEAKVLLSVRDPESWYKSMVDTIYQPMKSPAPDGAPDLLRLQSEMVRKAILDETFDNRFEERPTRSRCSGAIHRKSATRSLQRGCWYSTFEKDGRRCAASSTCPSPTSRSRASTIPRPRKR